MEKATHPDSLSSTPEDKSYPSLIVCASATPTILVAEEGVVVKSLEDVREPCLDPRVNLSKHDRPSEEDLDQGLTRQLSNLIMDSKSSSHSLEFAPGDMRNPANFTRRRKWAITAIACFFTMLICEDFPFELTSCGTLAHTRRLASAASAYNMGFPSMTKELQITNLEATAGLSLYAFGFGIVPLVTASLSEEFGRLPLYYVSTTMFAAMYIGIALAQNLPTLLVCRFIQGSFGSTGATMVGGTIADIWSAKERGLPMSAFSLSAIGGASLGPVFSGWVEMNPRLQWRWIQWIQLIICGCYLVILPFVLKETRSSILLTKIAKKLRKETGDNIYRARVEDERAKLSTLIWISCTRPIYLMFTEPVVLSFSLWIGFAWGIFFCMIERIYHNVRSIAVVFTTLHDFNMGQVGTVFVTMVIGCFLGLCSNTIQEAYYQKHFKRRGPEARLYLACYAAFILPIGMFIYAWCSFSKVHWISLAIAIVVFHWALFIIYLSVFSYLADCYGPFASSALAGQSLARNLAGTAFPLFTQQMYRNLTFKWANTLFGCIAALMIPIPFVLFLYGPSIRSRSRFSRAVMEAEGSSGKTL
ncbi:MFS polyamine transporter [Crepidotus variabilis]|uniref:MFS polyamine transporter n=1 Tax=Crepidotus variabilis TaxID=179855 RepID=A0A9P6E9B1_9AGAR|nr:MFS polyamine transporter [Crepidotus variabilis]